MSETPPPNKRRSQRRQARGSTRVVCLKGTLGLGQNVGLAVQNLSEEGACIRVRVALERGQEVELHLESLQHRRAVKVPARVVWVNPLEGDVWLVGLQFEHPLPYRDLQALTQS